MTVSATSFEIYYLPARMRAMATGMTVFLGALVIVGAVANYSVFGVWRTADVTALFVGLAFVLLGVFFLWIYPIPPRQQLLKATSDGLCIAAAGLPQKRSGHIFAPWSDVGALCVECEEAWCLKIAVRLSEQDRIGLRNQFGGYSRDSSGFVALTVPVPSKRRGVQTVATLHRFREMSAGPA